MNTDLIQTIADGFTIVTPTKRLARLLRQQYTDVQLAQQKQVWETPAILSWSSYMIHIWRQMQTPTVLLNSLQQRVIWQQIIDSSNDSKTLLDTSILATQSYNALQKARQWQLEIFPPESWLNHDQITFHKWVNDYQQQCTENKWLDAMDLEAEIIKLGAQRLQQVPLKLYLRGFDELMPVQQALLQFLQTAGAQIERVAPIINSENQVTRIEFTDQQTEIKALAHWLRAQIEADPNITIGVIVPDLANHSDCLQNTLDDILLPSTLLSFADHNQRPYNITLGKPLADYPLIHTALNILNLQRSRIPWQDISELLRTPFIVAADSEMLPRANLDARLREQGTTNILFRDFQRYLQKSPWRSSCLHLATALQTYAQHHFSQPIKQSYAAWMQAFSELLKALSWPGERSLNSNEYQLIEAWQEALTQVASVDLIGKQVNWNTALSLLQQYLHQHIHQPASIDVPVQIMGMLESTGIPFDQLWVMGLHSDNWPPPASPDPFIPQMLQARAGMRGATPQIALEDARKITQRLASSAAQVIFSATLISDQTQLYASPLLKHWPLTELEQQPTIDYVAEIFASQQLEYYADPQGLASGLPPSTGGATLLKDQAACPFRAFAKHRLSATGLRTADLGLNPMQRGQLVHDCLQLFWQTTSTQQNLKALTATALQKSVEQSVEQAIKKFQHQQLFSSSNTLLQLEKERLSVLLQQWLAIEKERPDFSVIETEQKHSCQVADLKINLRIDRIDQLADGGLVIIDYKTATTDHKTQDWMGERPKEPQLPLYAAVTEGNITAVAFVQFKQGQIKSIGLVRNDYEPVPLQGLKTLEHGKHSDGIEDWQCLLVHWQQVLGSLAEEFNRGLAHVDPREPSVCDYCDLGSLCRISEFK